MYLDLAASPQRGSIDSPIVLVEFADYECPFCQRHAVSVGRQILDSELIESGTMPYVFANNPLPSHPNARFLATAALCAGQQGRFWQMHGALFESLPRTEESVKSLASELDIDSVDFERRLVHHPELDAQIDMEMGIAGDLGLTGTPGFALGRRSLDGTVSRLLKNPSSAWIPFRA